MSLAILFHFLCAQHVLDINISIIRSLRLCCWITTSVVLFLVRCVLEIWCSWVWVVSVLQAVVIQQHSHKLLMMDILMSKICWAHKWNKIASDIKLVFYSSTITMMYSPINIRFTCTICWSVFFHASKYHGSLRSAWIWSILHSQMPCASLWSKHIILHLYPKFILILFTASQQQH